MDRILDIGQEAHGVIAIGQFATGVVAIGQVAFGVIAIGQVARGVVAVGQASLGIVSVGMVAAGVGYTVAIIGVGGVAGAGFVIPLVPSLRRKPILPRTTPLAALQADPRGAGWLGVELEAGAGNALRLVHRDNPVPARFSRRIWKAARSRAQELPGRVLVYLEHVGDELVVTRLMGIPEGRRGLGCVFGAGLQFAGLCGVAVAFWLAVAQPLIRELLVR